MAKRKNEQKGKQRSTKQYT